MAGQADGSIIIDTELDSKGFKAGSAELLAAIKSLTSRVEKLQKQMQKVGAQKIATDEYKQVQQDIAQAEKYLDQYNQKRAKLSEKGKVNTSEWKALIEDINAASAELSRLRTLKAEMERTGTAYISGTETENYQNLNAALTSSMQRLVEIQAELARINSKWAQMPTLTGYVKSTILSIGSAIKSAFGTVGTAITHPLQAADRLFGSLLQKAGQFVRTTAKTGINKLVSGLKSAVSHMTRLVTQSKMLKRPLENMSFLLRRIAPSLLMTEGLFGLLRKAVNAFLQENEQLAANLNACWSGIGNILGPIITRLINLVSTAVAYITQFLALLGFVGKSTTKAISSAGGSASKETDKLKRQLASFDELNILSDNSSDSGGGGGSSTSEAETPDVTLPDWVKTMVDHLKSGEWSAAATVLTEQLNNMVASVDWAGVGSNIAYWLDGALEFLATAILTFDWYNLGVSLGEMINSIIHGVDWANLGVVLGWKFIALIEGLGGFFATLDWVGLGKALSDAFMGLWNAIDWKQAAQTINDGVIGALNTIFTAVATVDWSKLGRDVGTFLSNIDWGGIIRTALSGLLGLPKMLFDFLSNAIKSTDWHGIAKGIASGIYDAVSNFDFVGTFTSLGEVVGATLRSALDIAQWIGEGISDAIDSAKTYFQGKIEECGGDIVAGIFKGIKDAICGIDQWVVDNIFTPFIEGFKSAFGIASPSTVMQEQGGFIVEGLLLGLQNAWSSLSTWIQEAFTGLTTTISNWASEATQSISTWASNAKSNISTWASNTKSNISNWAGNTKSSITTWVSNTKSSISTWANNTKSNITSWVSNTKSSVTTWASNVKSSISTWASNTKSNISTWASTTKSNITSWVSSTKSSISSWASNMYSTIQSKTNSVKSTLSSGFTTAKNSIVNNMRTAMNTVKGQNWYSVGSNICSGIRNGINAGWSWLKTTVSNLARNLLSAAKSALGIHSPSTLFRDAVGLNIGYGVGEGIEAAEGSVLNSVVGVADAIAGEFNSNEYSIGGVVSNTDIDSALTAFSDKIAGSFTSLLDRLQTIADSAAFKVPTVATGAVPFSTSATVNGGGNGASVSDSIEASNEALSSVVIQSITNATAAIVTAIQNYSGTTVNLDADSLSDSVISEINRKTRMNGKSPLLI